LHRIFSISCVGVNSVARFVFVSVRERPATRGILCSTGYGNLVMPVASTTLARSCGRTVLRLRFRRLQTELAATMRRCSWATPLPGCFSVHWLGARSNKPGPYRPLSQAGNLCSTNSSRAKRHSRIRVTEGSEAMRLSKDSLISHRCFLE
jgi:hypothetical protein